MHGKTKICLIIPSLNAGGMERVMSELANYFADKEGLEVHLIMYGKSPGTFYKLSSKIIVHQPADQFNDSFRVYSTVNRLIYLRKTVKKIHPQSILSFGEYWNNFVLLALIGIKIPVYVSDRCKPDKSLGNIHNKLRHWLYSNSAGVVVQTEKALEIYQQIISAEKLKVIGNPIRSISEACNISQEKLILMVSRIINTKHHDRLIKIFLQLNAPEWKLVFVGGEAQKQKHLEVLKQLTLDLGISEKVRFEGEQKNVEDYYQKSSIFAFTSSSEGFPNVIGEALSAGLPVVSYDCVAGPSDMITDGENGFLVPVFDDEIFKQKLQLLIDNEDLRNHMAVNAKKSVEKFSVEFIGQQYLDFILQ